MNPTALLLLSEMTEAVATVPAALALCQRSGSHLQVAINGNSSSDIEATLNRLGMAAGDVFTLPADNFSASLNQLIEQQPQALLLIPEDSPLFAICQEQAEEHQLPVQTIKRDLAPLKALIGHNEPLAQMLEQGTPFVPDQNKLIVAWAGHQDISSDMHCPVCQAFVRLAEASDISIVFPVRKEMTMQQVIYQSIDWRENIHLLEPLEPLAFLHLLSRADLVVTSSVKVAAEAEELGSALLLLDETGENSADKIEKLTKAKLCIG